MLARVVSNLVQLEREALRVYERYVIEFVEEFSFCPWAVRAREQGHVSPRVVLGNDPADLERSLEVTREVSRDDHCQVALLIYPRFEVTRAQFSKFVSRLREADPERQMAMAAFHPEACANLDSPERCVPFIRRSPDPTIQLVRLKTLDEVRRPSDSGTGFVDLTEVNVMELLKTPPKRPLHERVADANLDTLKKISEAKAEGVLSDIFEDRKQAYSALGF